MYVIPNGFRRIWRRLCPGSCFWTDPRSIMSSCMTSGSSRRFRLRRKRGRAMYCNPDVCPNCMYIGEGDSLCDALQEIVLADWSPTEHYMGPGCPYRLPSGKKQRRKPEARKTEMNRDVTHMTPVELAEAATYVRKGWKIRSVRSCAAEPGYIKSIWRATATKRGRSSKELPRASILE